ncbi:MAG: 4-(cytidine 5'-diphospho)-2-C-methyl-D-erythritol kinase, partial [Halocynthiibacter sp.]
MTTRAFAPAKVNLTLHVTGRQSDGYHLLNSLVVFADVGDWVSAEPADALSLSVIGPMAAAVPDDGRNLVCKAAELIGVNAALTLEKILPVAAGLGGGSTDAAATLFALADLSGLPVPRDKSVTLGADVPVCLRSTRSLMRGIGDVVEPAPHLPKLDAVLVSPGVALSTASVFGAIADQPGPSGDVTPGPLATFAEVVSWLDLQRNDLQAAATKLAPVIADVMQALNRVEGCELA